MFTVFLYATPLFVVALQLSSSSSTAPPRVSSKPGTLFAFDTFTGLLMMLLYVMVAIMWHKQDLMRLSSTVTVIIWCFVAVFLGGSLICGVIHHLCCRHPRQQREDHQEEEMKEPEFINVDVNSKDDDKKQLDDEKDDSKIHMDDDNAAAAADDDDDDDALLEKSPHVSLLVSATKEEEEGDASSPEERVRLRAVDNFQVKIKNACCSLSLSPSLPAPWYPHKPQMIYFFVNMNSKSSGLSLSLNNK